MGCAGWGYFKNNQQVKIVIVFLNYIKNLIILNVNLISGK